MKIKFSCLKLGLAASAFALVMQGQALVINATFDSSITGLSNATAVENCINSMITYYQNTITNNVTMKVTFKNMNSGLGMSNTGFYTTTYANYLTNLTATASSSAIDTAALAQLANDPYTGANVAISAANGRAIGLNTPGSPDGTIFLNTSLCFTNHNSPVSGKYDLYAVAAHELDEVMGTSSGVGSSFQNADLFRYDGSGNRSFTTDTSKKAYFSVDGTNLIEQYNTSGTGDWGDWIQHNPPQVQDWAGTAGQTINVGSGELDLLDAIGWNIQTQSVPEPSAFVALAVGALALVRRRRR